MTTTTGPDAPDDLTVPTEELPPMAADDTADDTAVPVPRDRWTWRTPEGRILSATAGIGALTAATLLGGPATWTFWVGLIGPDVAFLKGLGEERDGPGALPRSAVGLYNGLHNPVAPVSVVALGLATLSRPLVVGGLGWFAHIAVDRAFGFGMRRPDGYMH